MACPPTAPIASLPTLVPKRQQFPVDLSGVRFKSRSDILKLQQQWTVFEQVENYNDVIYQRFSLGYRDKPYYQFRTNAELNEYRNGQELHILRYPALASAGTFTSISSKSVPTVSTILTQPSEFTQVPKCIGISTTMTASERVAEQADLNIYIYVSTYNSDHVYKYIFTGNEEKMSYHRAERRVLCGDSV